MKFGLLQKPNVNNASDTGCSWTLSGSRHVMAYRRKHTKQIKIQSHTPTCLTASLLYFDHRAVSFICMSPHPLWLTELNASTDRIITGTRWQNSVSWLKKWIMYFMLGFFIERYLMQKCRLFAFFVCLFLLPKTKITTTHLVSLINNFYNANFIKTNLKITVKTCLETLVKITQLWFLFLLVDIAEIIHDMKITLCTQLNGRKRVREKPDGWASETEKHFWSPSSLWCHNRCFAFWQLVKTAAWCAWCSLVRSTTFPRALNDEKCSFPLFLWLLCWSSTFIPLWLLRWI